MNCRKMTERELSWQCNKHWIIMRFTNYNDTKSLFPLYITGQVTAIPDSDIVCFLYILQVK